MEDTEAYEKAYKKLTTIRPPNHHVNYCSVPSPVPRPEADIHETSTKTSAPRSASVHPVGEPVTMRSGREVSTLYSRQLLPNAAMAASRVGS
jgi:hypothetical protein